MDTTRWNEINLNFFFVLLWTIRARKWQSWKEEKEPVEMQKLRSRTVTLVTKNHQQQAIEPGSGLDHLNKLLVPHAAGIFCSITAVLVHSSVLSTSISSTLDIELSQRKKNRLGTSHLHATFPTAVPRLHKHAMLLASKKVSDCNFSAGKKLEPDTKQKIMVELLCSWQSFLCNFKNDFFEFASPTEEQIWQIIRVMIALCVTLRCLEKKKSGHVSSSTPKQLQDKTRYMARGCWLLFFLVRLV